MTLTDFLLARITEDEEAAYAAVEPPPGYRSADTPDPAAKRLLAECEAWRSVIEDVLWQEGHWGGADHLRIKASTYADHPDYREEWRA